MKKTSFIIAAFFLALFVQAQTRNFKLVQTPTAGPTDQQRKAVVIGQSDYGGDRSLSNTINDATDMAAVLAKLGFEVTLLKNNDLRSLKTNLTNWYNSIGGTDMAIFYYAGHGMEVNGENYLIPIDAELNSQTDVEFNALNVNQVLGNMDEKKVGMKLLILDACRNNPFKRSWSRGSESKGLAQMAAPKGTYIAFAASPGFTAQDGGNYNLTNGVFTHFLKQELAKPGLSINEIFDNVTGDVATLTHDQQTPFKNSSLTKSFYFIPGTNNNKPGDPMVQPKQMAVYYYYVDQNGSENDQHFASKKEAEAHMRANKLYGKIYSNAGEAFLVEEIIVPKKSETPANTNNTTDKLKQAEDFYNNKMYDRAFALYSGLRENEMDGSAMNHFGLLYYNGQGVSKDYTLAKNWFEKSVNAGYPGAMNNLGVMYKTGTGVKQDYVQAKYWYEKAANTGHPVAMNNLAVMYQYGTGVTQDFNQAKYWFEKAALANNDNAMVSLGEFYYAGQVVKQDYAQAKYWFEKAANAGNSKAMDYMGFLYKSGISVPLDYAQAKYWYEKAATGGDADAMLNLGFMYDVGMGVNKDYVQAKYWYEKAANGGKSTAMNNLAILYEAGNGVTKDYIQAKYWYEKAAEGGEKDAMNSLGILYFYGMGANLDYAWAKYWFEKGSVAGDPVSMHNLGFMYENGKGVPKDLTTARYWYKKATDAGFKNTGRVLQN